jgi:hypothetical protein
MKQGNGSTNNVTFKVSDADNLKWKVLGVDETTGELLIVTSDILSTQLPLYGVIGYTYGIDELNKVCSVYGHGEGATGGRSITVDDVNNAIGRKVTPSGNKWTFYWNKTTLTNNSPRCSLNGAASTTYLGYSHKFYNTDSSVEDKYMFNFYNESTNKWETSLKTASELTAMGDKEETIGTVTHTWYSYNIKDATSGDDSRQYASNGYSVVFQAETKDGELADFANGADAHIYWLGSSYSSAGAYYAIWGMRCVNGSGCVNSDYLYTSMGCRYGNTRGVRPVVSLKSDIQLKETGVNNTYDIQ